MTSPPCAENVVWFVASNPIPLGHTVIEFIRDALNIPKIMAGSKEAIFASNVPDNFDGNNR